MTDPVNTLLHLRADGVAVVIELLDGQLPAIVHWGADLGDLDVADVSAIVLTGVAPIVPNVVDEPVRVALLPEHHTGLGRPPGAERIPGRPRLVATLHHAVHTGRR